MPVDQDQLQKDVEQLLQVPDRFLYLASPYTHPDPDIQLKRFHDVCDYAAKLLSEGTPVFSPIAHSHPIAIHGETENTFDFWMTWDMPFLHLCSGVVVMTIPGWRESRGVQTEIALATKLGKSVTFSDHEERAVEELHEGSGPDVAKVL